MTFSERVKEIRNEHNMNQTEFAKILGLSRDAYANFEYDRFKNPNAKEPTIKAICNMFGINEAWLRDGTEPKFAPQDRNTEIAQTIAKYSTEESDAIRDALTKVLQESTEVEIISLYEMIKKATEEIEKAKKDLPK